MYPEYISRQVPVLPEINGLYSEGKKISIN